MTTFNLKNQSNKNLCFKVVACLVISGSIIASVIYLVDPDFFEKIDFTDNAKTKSSNEDLSQANIFSSSSSSFKNAAEIKTTTTTTTTTTTIAPDNSIIVETLSGKVRGKTLEQIGVEVNTFLGIPYGEPPTGDLRFRKTVPVKPWFKTLNATKLPPACLQSEYTQKLYPAKILNYETSEDCLYLNIWAPANSTDELPVIIYIHGGMFTIGSTGVDEYDGSVIAAYGNVVVVTIQYRLGLFGFLDFNIERIPGNMGLWDQAEAIKWVHRNIKYFGGDSSLITLAGQSAGGISIGLHMNSEIRHLFKRVILQSGSPMLINQVYSRAEEVANKFAEKVGCLPNITFVADAPLMVAKCIETKPLSSLMSVQQEMVKDNPVPFLPTIPSSYIQFFPDDEYNNSEAFQKEFLIGFNEEEGNLILHLSYPKNFTRTTVPSISTLEKARDTMVQMAIDGGFPEFQSRTMASILLRGNETDSAENFARKIGTVFGDMMFVCPTLKFADIQAKANKTIFMYVFGQRAHNSVWGSWMGVTHHDEINFVFGMPLRYPNIFHGTDIDLSKRVIQAWTHFAKTGSVRTEFFDDWPLYSTTNKAYREIKSKNSMIGSRFHEQTCNLIEALVDYLK